MNKEFNNFGNNFIYSRAALFRASFLIVIIIILLAIGCGQQTKPSMLEPTYAKIIPSANFLFDGRVFVTIGEIERTNSPGSGYQSIVVYSAINPAIWGHLMFEQTAPFGKQPTLTDSDGNEYDGEWRGEGGETEIKVTGKGMYFTKGLKCKFVFTSLPYNIRPSEFYFFYPYKTIWENNFYSDWYQIRIGLKEQE